MTANKKEQDTPIRKLDLGKGFGAAVISINGIIIGIDKRGALSLPTEKTKDPTAKQLDLGPNFGAAEILINGRTLSISGPDLGPNFGSAEIYINGHTLSISAPESLTPQSKQAPANDAAPVPATKSAVTPKTKIGAVMPDGTIYAGLYAPGNQHLFLPGHIPLTLYLCDWDQAQERIAALSSNGHTDWCLPTARQLTDLFNRSTQLPNHLFTDDDFFWTSEECHGDAARVFNALSNLPVSFSMSKKNVACAIPVRTAPNPSP